MHHLVATPLLALALMPLACGMQRPVVLNASQSSVEVRVLYSDGDSTSRRLEPGRRLSLDDASGNPREVTIILATGEQFSYSASDASAFLSSLPGGTALGWKVSESGVTRLTSHDLQ